MLSVLPRLVSNFTNWFLGIDLSPYIDFQLQWPWVPMAACTWITLKRLRAPGLTGWSILFSSLVHLQKRANGRYTTQLTLIDFACHDHRLNSRLEMFWIVAGQVLRLSCLSKTRFQASRLLALHLFRLLRGRAHSSALPAAQTLPRWVRSDSSPHRHVDAQIRQWQSSGKCFHVLLQL